MLLDKGSYKTTFMQKNRTFMSCPIEATLIICYKKHVTKVVFCEVLIMVNTGINILDDFIEWLFGRP